MDSEHSDAEYELFVAEGASMPAIAENDKYVSCILRLQPEVVGIVQSLALDSRMSFSIGFHMMHRFCFHKVNFDK